MQTAIFGTPRYRIYSVIEYTSTRKWIMYTSSVDHGLSTRRGKEKNQPGLPKEEDA